MANETKKSRFTKSTIAMIVCLAFIGALILATILMAIIPTDKGIRFSEPDYMEISYDGKTLHLLKNANSDDEKESFKQIWEAYQNAGKQPVIAALFGGYAGQGMNADYSSSPKDYSNLGASSSSDSDSESETESVKSFVINFQYFSEQTMINGNGSDYVYGEVDNKVTPKFTAAYIEITNDNSMQLRTAYLKSTNDSDSSKKTYITYTGIANFNSLYDLLKTMEGKFL